MLLYVSKQTFETLFLSDDLTYYGSWQSWEKYLEEIVDIF